MNPFAVGGIAFAVLLGCLIMGIPIAFAAFIVGTTGLLIIGGTEAMFSYLGIIPYSEVAYYGYTLIPLFIIMGEFAFYGGYGGGLYWTARQWIGKLPGGLCLATIIGGAGFGAACGSSVAASAVLGKICIPEMRKYGYAPSLAAGSVASCANLASMIPPSGLMIIYAILTDQSVGKLLIAGIMPGILLTLLFSIMIYARCRRNPSLGPSMTESVSWKEKFLSIWQSWGIFVIVIVIIGGIYTGIFTPTEAGAIGAVASLVLGLVTRKLTLQNLKLALISGTKTSAMVLLIIAGVMVFTRFLAISRMPLELSQLLIGLPVHPAIILSAMLLFYLFIGMFFDAVSMLVLTLPLFFPCIIALGYDPIWFGVICVLMCEIGLITPPVGVNCYVVAGTAPDIPLGQIFRGILPFVVMNLIAVVILVVFPQICLFLPSQMTT